MTDQDRVRASVGRGEEVEEAIALPVGLVLLIGPPSAGKSSFARAGIEQGRIDRDGVVSCDAIRAEMFGGEVRTSDDPAVFDEMGARIAARLAVGDPVVVDATNVTAERRHECRLGLSFTTGPSAPCDSRSKPAFSSRATRLGRAISGFRPATC